MYPDESGCTDFVREVLEGADSDTIAALAHLASGESMVVSMNDSLNCANSQGEARKRLAPALPYRLSDKGRCSGKRGRVRNTDHTQQESRKDFAALACEPFWQHRLPHLVRQGLASSH